MFERKHKNPEKSSRKEFDYACDTPWLSHRVSRAENSHQFAIISQRLELKLAKCTSSEFSVGIWEEENK